MKKGKHTRGAWEVREDENGFFGVWLKFGSNGFDYPIAEDVGGDRTDKAKTGRPIDNARLIAYAPTLLNFLIEATNIIKSEGLDHPDETEMVECVENFEHVINYLTVDEEDA